MSSTSSIHHQTPPSTVDNPATAQARTKRVQWAPKARVEHFELPVCTTFENDEPRMLDEHAQDPTALAHLHRALESFQQPEGKASTSILPPLAPAPLHEENAHVEVELAEQRLWESRARDLVRTHSKRFVARVNETAGRALRRGRRTTRTEDEKHNEHEQDLEANTPQTSNNIAPLPLGRGRGVLSTLLALYDTNSASVSTATSAATSRSSSPVGATRQPSDFESQLSTDTISTSPPSLDEHVPRASRKPTFPNPILPSSVRRGALSIPSPGSHSRPKTARSAGGVVGSLIATSGNIIGPAAPSPSSVAPDVKRRGWGLSRYALAPDDMLHRYMHSAPATPPHCYSREDFSGAAPDTESGSGTATPTFSYRTPPDSLQRPKRSAWNLLPRAMSTSAHGSRSSSPSRWPSSHSKGGTPPPEATNDASVEKLGFDHENGKAYRRDRKDRRRKAKIFITKHVAEVMQRQEFLLKLARALMMFAAPTHRLQAQIQATARVLDLETSTLYIPNVILIAFGDDATGTSNIKLIQQSSNLDLGKLLDAHRLYWNVIHDKISVSSASASLELLMRMPPLYRGWQIVLVGGMCSGAICPLAFSGSFVDSLMAAPLGALLVLVQILSSRNELYSNVFEITIATLLSFISAGLASTSHFCYAALASSSVVLILPGFIVLSGSLELASRQIVSGAVRICFAAIYSLFLGFGIAIGADMYSRVTRLPSLALDDITCSSSHHADGPWWQRTASVWWAFLCVPLYSLVLSLRNQAPLLRKELVVTILLSCAGWAANHFSGIAFVHRPDIQSAVGAFAVGIVANVYARFFKGNAYVVMITGILFQLPSGLANGGLLTFAEVDNQGQQLQSYRAGFQVAMQLIAVAIGLTVGLFTSVVVVHPLGGSRRQAAGLFSL